MKKQHTEKNVESGSQSDEPPENAYTLKRQKEEAEALQAQIDELVERSPHRISDQTPNLRDFIANKMAEDKEAESEDQTENGSDIEP